MVHLHWPRLDRIRYQWVLGNYAELCTLVRGRGLVGGLGSGPFSRSQPSSLWNDHLAKCTQFPVHALSFPSSAINFNELLNHDVWHISHLFVPKIFAPSFPDTSKNYLLINGNEVDVCILIRREKYQSIS